MPITTCYGVVLVPKDMGAHQSFCHAVDQPNAKTATKKAYLVLSQKMIYTGQQERQEKGLFVLDLFNSLAHTLQSCYRGCNFFSHATNVQCVSHFPYKARHNCRASLKSNQRNPKKRVFLYALQLILLELKRSCSHRFYRLVLNIYTECRGQVVHLSW